MDFEIQFQYINKATFSIERIITVFKNKNNGVVKIQDFKGDLTETKTEILSFFYLLGDESSQNQLQSLENFYKYNKDFLVMPNGKTYQDDLDIDDDYQIVKITKDGKIY